MDLKEIEMRVIEKFGDVNFADEVLDGVVHDIKSSEATEINNDGFIAQVTFLLLKGVKGDDIMNLIEEGS